MTTKQSKLKILCWIWTRDTWWDRSRKGWSDPRPLKSMFRISTWICIRIVLWPQVKQGRAAQAPHRVKLPKSTMAPMEEDTRSILKWKWEWQQLLKNHLTMPSPGTPVQVRCFVARRHRTAISVNLIRASRLSLGWIQTTVVRRGHRIWYSKKWKAGR